MEICQFTWNIVDSNSWLILEGPHGLLIDAVDSEELYEAIEHLASLSIILTHSHFDHIIGLNKIRSLRSDCTVIATKLCSENIGNIYRNLSSTATAFMAFYEQGKKRNIEIEPFTCESAQVTFDDKGMNDVGDASNTGNTGAMSDMSYMVDIDDADDGVYGSRKEMVFDWHGHKVELKTVYGHSNDGLVAIIDRKLLFSGDTLLAIPTVTRLPGGSTKRFKEEDMPLLKNSFSNGVIYPGHGERFICPWSTEL